MEIHRTADHRVYSLEPPFDNVGSFLEIGSAPFIHLGGISDLLSHIPLCSRARGGIESITDSYRTHPRFLLPSRSRRILCLPIVRRDYQPGYSIREMG